MLPYQNLQEAEVALGKELSFAQNLWFNYSANKSDYFLYAHNLFFLLLFYTIVPLPLALMELKGSKYMEKYKLQPKVKCSYKDMIRCYKDVVKVFFIAVGPLSLVSYPLIKWVGIRTNLQLSSGWEMFWQILLYFIVEDYGNYWIHRWLHGKWGYEHIHWMHHEFTAPIGFAAPYAHWAEILALGFPAFVGPALAPCHLITFWLWMVLRQIESIETHCGYDFPWTPSKYIPFYGGAEYHDYHHYIGGQSQSNFASVFTYCDYIYGTDKGYRYQKGVLQKGKKEKI